MSLIDLLVDVIIHEEGIYEVVDVEELDEALAAGLITEEQKVDALQKVSALTKLIDEKQFPPFEEMNI